MKSNIKDNIENIKKDYIKGHTLSELLKKYRISHNTLIKTLKEHNIEVKRRNSTRQFNKNRIFLNSLAIVDILISLFDIQFIGDILLLGNYRADNRHIIADKVIYICIDTDTQTILKVGQSCNWMGRVAHYKYRPGFNGPIRVLLFSVDTWDLQDKLEHSIRKYLISLGHILPWDNTNCRLEKIK